ncbi:hypothetical protein OCU04_002280 [Sclerotinia nivalis]|uniref:Apple domain-containing protein n=1 Tax=Sclerotinia nivalis TaxID=352851 RepID=A0A9X0DM07_9HELO|nr:hypothetical protein OCU04_002280 [Sclerotinia nivalis]
MSGRNRSPRFKKMHKNGKSTKRGRPRKIENDKKTLVKIEKALGQAQRINADRDTEKEEMAREEPERTVIHSYDGEKIYPYRNMEDSRAALPSTKASVFKKREKIVKHKRSKLFDSGKEAYKSFKDCGRACEDQKECFQWVYYDRTCRLSTSIRLGNYQAPTNGKDKGEDGKPEQVGWKSE